MIEIPSKQVTVFGGDLKKKTRVELTCKLKGDLIYPTLDITNVDDKKDRVLTLDFSAFGYKNIGHCKISYKELSQIVRLGQTVRDHEIPASAPQSGTRQNALVRITEEIIGHICKVRIRIHRGSIIANLTLKGAEHSPLCRLDDAAIPLDSFFNLRFSEPIE
jgi:hypothetical protein